MPQDDHERLELDQRQPSAAPEPRRDLSVPFVLLATVAFFVARIPLIPRRVFDPDEFEHSHAAWSLFRGLLPYKDFFEHHTPWYYFALSPFFRWFAVDQSFESARHFLFFARACSLALAALSVVVVIRVGRLAGKRLDTGPLEGFPHPPAKDSVEPSSTESTRRVGLLTGLFLAGQPVFIQKTMEIRPDVPALLFFLGALWFLLRGLSEPEDSATASLRPNRLRGFRLRWFLGGGLCLGAAIMCTQKMLFALPGALLGLGLWALADRRQALLARMCAVLMVCVGVAVPALFTWIEFAVHGGGRQFIYDNFLLNAKWQLGSVRGVVVTLKTSWPILLLALLGASVSMYRFFRTRQRHYGDVLLLCILGGLIAGIAVVRVAYEQYCLMPLAIACLFGAKGLSFLADALQERARGWFVVCATLLLLVLPVRDLRRSFTLRNDREMARLRYVFEHTGPTDTVLDGWMGTQLFRPHPLYYAFMHRELLVMLSESDKESYLGPLESGTVRPSLITLDDELMALGPRFLRFVQANYETSDGLFYFPVRTSPPARGGEHPSGER
jgi:hypothetical protein